jgi:hypothetical protein
MKNNSFINGNGRIEALKEKERKIRASLAAAVVQQQRANAKLQAREFATVGEALVKYASQSPEFRTMLSQVLPVAVTDEKTRQFLAGRGWF